MERFLGCNVSWRTKHKIFVIAFITAWVAISMATAVFVSACVEYNAADFAENVEWEDKARAVLGSSTVKLGAIAGSFTGFIYAAFRLLYSRGYVGYTKDESGGLHFKCVEEGVNEGLDDTFEKYRKAKKEREIDAQQERIFKNFGGEKATFGHYANGNMKVAICGRKYGAKLRNTVNYWFYVIVSFLTIILAGAVYSEKVSYEMAMGLMGVCGIGGVGYGLFKTILFTPTVVKTLKIPEGCRAIGRGAKELANIEFVSAITDAACATGRFVWMCTEKGVSGIGEGVCLVGEGIGCVFSGLGDLRRRRMIEVRRSTNRNQPTKTSKLMKTLEDAIQQN